MNELTQDLVRELFDYRAGNLYWKESGSGRKIGIAAGSVDKEGYKIITVKGKRYKAHRLIFLFHHDYLPEFLDHIDGNPSNNNISNLREATTSQNQMNRKKIKSINGKPTSSKYTGVVRHKRDKKWQGSITIDGIKIFLGYFTSELETAKAYNRAAIKRDGKFVRLNKIPIPRSVGDLRREGDGNDNYTPRT